MNKFIHWLKKEIITLIPAVIYFAICFNFFHFAQGLMMPPENIHYTSYLGATIGALLAGKIIMIADCLPFFNAFPHKPIIYNITWKFCIYGFFVLLVQMLDYITKDLYLTKNWSIAFSNLVTNIGQPLFWGIQAFVLMFFLFLIIFTEIMRVVGQEKMRKIFFG